MIRILAIVLLASLSGCSLVERFNSLPVEQRVAIGASVLVTGYIAKRELERPDGGMRAPDRGIDPPSCANGSCR